MIYRRGQIKRYRNFYWPNKVPREVANKKLQNFPHRFPAQFPKQTTAKINHSQQKFPKQTAAQINLSQQKFPTEHRIWITNNSLMLWDIDFFLIFFLILSWYVSWFSILEILILHLIWYSKNDTFLLWNLPLKNQNLRLIFEPHQIKILILINMRCSGPLPIRLRQGTALGLWQNYRRLGGVPFLWRGAMGPSFWLCAGGCHWDRPGRLYLQVSHLCGLSAGLRACEYDLANSSQWSESKGGSVDVPNGTPRLHSAHLPICAQGLRPHRSVWLQGQRGNKACALQSALVSGGGMHVDWGAHGGTGKGTPSRPRYSTRDITDLCDSLSEGIARRGSIACFWGCRDRDCCLSTRSLGSGCASWTRGRKQGPHKTVCVRGIRRHASAITQGPWRWRWRYTPPGQSQQNEPYKQWCPESSPIPAQPMFYASTIRYQSFPVAVPLLFGDPPSVTNHTPFFLETKTHMDVS